MGLVFTLPSGKIVPVEEIPDEIVAQSRAISRFYRFDEYFLDEEGVWRLNDGRKLIKYVNLNDRRRYTIQPQKNGQRRELMPAPDARKKSTRTNAAERAKMGITEVQSKYIDRYIVTGGKDPEGFTHKQLCRELDITEQTARNWVRRNKSFQAEAHRRVGSDIANPINLQRLWDTLLKSATGKLEGQEGPNPVDAKAALGLMEKAGFLTPPSKDESAPDLSNMSDEELMDLAVSAVVRAYPEVTQEEFVDIMVNAWEDFFGVDGDDS